MRGFILTHILNTLFLACFWHSFSCLLALHPLPPCGWGLRGGGGLLARALGIRLPHSRREALRLWRTFSWPCATRAASWLFLAVGSSPPALPRGSAHFTGPVWRGVATTTQTSSVRYSALSVTSPFSHILAHICCTLSLSLYLDHLHSLSITQLVGFLWARVLSQASNSSWLAHLLAASATLLNSLGSHRPTA